MPCVLHHKSQRAPPSIIYRIAHYSLCTPPWTSRLASSYSVPSPIAALVIIPFLVASSVPFETPTYFPTICSPYFTRRVFSVSSIVPALEDPLSQPISIAITLLQLAVTKKHAMSSTICSPDTPSCIPFRCPKPALPCGPSNSGFAPSDLAHTFPIPSPHFQPYRDGNHDEDRNDLGTGSKSLPAVRACNTVG